MRNPFDTLGFNMQAVVKFYAILLANGIGMPATHSNPSASIRPSQKPSPQCCHPPVSKAELPSLS